MKIGIRAVEFCLMFNSDGSELGIRGKIPSYTNTFEVAEEKLCKPITRMENANGCRIQPLTNTARRLLCTHRLFHDPWICHQANKSAYDNPRQAHRNLSVKHSLPPNFGLLMLWSLVVVGVNQQINVWDDHLRALCFARNSSASSSSAN